MQDSEVIDGMPTSVTHVAGPIMICDLRILQRCAICGEKMIDTTLAQTGDQFAAYPPGKMVSHDGGKIQVGQCFFHRAEKLPADFCLALVER